MPRSGDPKDIKVGTGKANQGSVDANSFTPDLASGIGGKHGIKAHVDDPQDAHPASAIGTTTTQGFYDGDDVQSDLDELSGLIPPRPPYVGTYLTNLGTMLTGSLLSGIPDWGHLKLNDAGHINRGNVIPPVPATPNADADVYPYYHFAPAFADDAPPFDLPGNDPHHDATFNLNPAGTGDPTYKGGGLGLAHAGGFTRGVAGGIGSDGPVIETARLMPTAGGAFRPIVLSGMVYPSDRGVLALIHWPADGDIGDFLAQDLTDRCPAALRLGQGLLDNCDGAPGGIFSEGDPDILAYPGRASGQYDLVELHTGLVGGTGPVLPPPFDVGVPSAGQVRLGQDPGAGVPVVTGGIPILGGTTNALGQDGDPYAPAGNDNNFFRYRLPYLEDYTAGSGPTFTPDAEKPRYFSKPLVALDYLTDLTQAGDYPNLPDDYWHFQIARYRHQFLFPQNAPLPPDPIDQGAWILFHFKREADFEAFVRDGIAPDDPTFGYETWSKPVLLFASSPESTDNIADPGTPFDTAEGYHVIRAATMEDPTANLITSTAKEYTFTATSDEVMIISGVQYFVPGTAGSEWTIDSMSLIIDPGVWTYNYNLGRLAASPAEITTGMAGQYPLFVYLGMFAAETGNIVEPSATTSFDGDEFAQRLEFRYDTLDVASGHGPFDLTNGPTIADNMTLALFPGDPMTFLGDVSVPHFTTDARIRSFVRKPLGHEVPAETALETLFDRPAGDGILFHTTDHNPTGGTGAYGNFLTGALFTPVRPSLETALKDVQERFLDEVYRYWPSNLFSVHDPTWDGTRGNISGPGLPFASAPIDLPVRIGSDAPTQTASWVQAHIHLLDVGSDPLVTPDAQVAGLPDRNPPITDGVVGPVPSTGILLYPQTDYTAGFRPRLGVDITTPQFDYTVASEPSRRYIRIFDAGYTRDASPEAIAGTKLVRFRIRGLRLVDFAWKPNPAGTPPGGSDEIAIFCKVPGLTSWMDMGRTDGAGPSKQDALNDGAGCKVIGPTTRDARDPVTGVWYSEVLINVGPAASFFQSSFGEVPVMVKVVMKAAGASLNFQQGGTDGTTNDVRGLIGIEVLRGVS